MTPSETKAKNLVYFDLETQKSVQEVGGWQNKRLMKMSIGVTYSTARGGYAIYPEEEVAALVTELQRADCVIGFNVIDFDFEVLAPYSLFDLSQAPRLDLMRSIEERLGRRIGLDAVAKSTLGIGKTAVGTDALRWWKEGRIADIAHYCCYDVKVTKLVHEYGAHYGCVYYQNERTHRREAIPVDWKL